MARTPNSFKADTENFVRTALSRGSDHKPSQEEVRKAVSKIVKAFQPIISQKDSNRK
jgi:hypothetical protein